MKNLYLIFYNCFQVAVVILGFVSVGGCDGPESRVEIDAERKYDLVDPERFTRMIEFDDPGPRGGANVFDDGVELAGCLVNRTKREVVRLDRVPVLRGADVRASAVAVTMMATYWQHHVGDDIIVRVDRPRELSEVYAEYVDITAMFLHELDEAGVLERGGFSIHGIRPVTIELRSPSDDERQ